MTIALDRKRRGDKSIWEWMEVFIVLFAIALFTTVFSVVQCCSQQQIESQRAQDAALQAYLDQMSRLLLEKDLRNSERGARCEPVPRRSWWRHSARAFPAEGSSAASVEARQEIATANEANSRTVFLIFSTVLLLSSAGICAPLPFGVKTVENLLQRVADRSGFFGYPLIQQPVILAT